MTKTVATLRILILLLACSLSGGVLATDITFTVSGASPYCGGTGATLNYDGTAFIFNAGNTFNAELSDATGSFASPVVIGTLSGTAQTGGIPITFPTTASGANYRVRIVASDPLITSSDNGSDLIINPAVITSVNILATPGNILCNSTAATFNATPTGGGTSPSYKWYRNNILVGSNSSSFSEGALGDGDQVRVEMTSNATCPLPVAAQSNVITMIVKTIVAPTVTIGGPPFICQGFNSQFTATPLNGGTAPSYQWKRNGNDVGTNSPVFITNSLISGDVILCVMTSNRACLSTPTATSNNIDITVTSVVTPAITITADPSGTVGAGSVVYVSSVVTGGGSAPVYEWKKNGVVVGTSNVLVVPAAANNDQVVATVTSNANCAQPTLGTSNTVNISVDDNLTQSNHSWVQRAGQGPVGNEIVRSNASGFSIGNKAYIGVGFVMVGPTLTYRKDFWEYDLATDAWTQKADFGGAARYNAVGFSIGTKGYIGMGLTAPGGAAAKDFWQYDQVNNTWTSRKPLTGQVREQAFGFSIGNKGYVGGGYAAGFGDFNDFYEYDPSSDNWAVKASFGGGKRLGAASFTIDTKGFVAGGYSTTSSTWFKDFWDYDQPNNIWTRRADMPGNPRTRATGFAVGGNGYVGLGNSSIGYEGQFFQYTFSTNTWSWKPYYPGPVTPNFGTGVSIGNRAFVYKDGTWSEYNFFTATSFSSKMCTTEGISVNYDASGFTFGVNNVFTAQISRQQDFSALTTVGMLPFNGGSGTINTVIPNNVEGNSYYFRIVSSNPPMSTMLETIMIAALPSSHSITAETGATACKDVAVTFNSNLSGSGFQWYKNNIEVGNDSENYVESSLATGDVIRCVRSYTAGCSEPVGVNSNTIVMTVRTPVKPTVTVSQPNVLTSTTAVSYQWYKDGAVTARSTGQSYSMTESGVYKVRIADSGGCFAFSDDVVNAFTGLYDEELAGQVSTYPNPVTGEMILEVADDLVTQGIEYGVLNELGQAVVVSQKASKSNRINFTGKAPGLYLIRLSINGATIIRRIVKVD